MRLFILMINLALINTVFAGQANINNLKIWDTPDKTRLEFKMSKAVEHKVFTLSNPERVVIDLNNTRNNTKLKQPFKDDPWLKKIRSAARDKNNYRIVLDLKSKVKPKSFILKSPDNKGFRLVIDLQGTAKQKMHQPQIVKQNKPKLRDIVIAIDAGHGGKDVGATGTNGTREKNVVLALAKKLKHLIQQQTGMKAIMVREGDTFLKLRQRIKIARKKRADLLISLHADAFHDRSVSGASVYALSSKGASSEAARWLAKRENAADLVGGVKLDDKDNVLASVLLDLSQSATIGASLNIGNQVLNKLKYMGNLHKETIQQANFVVLKSPDIPSILIETAFISNPSEEKKLNNPKHQLKMAKAIMKGVKSYFIHHPPPGTLYAAHKHIIVPGETLTDIAKQYQVQITNLKTLNHLRSDNIKIGQILNIPRANDS